MLCDRFIRERERKEITGVPVSSWYEMMGKGEAPHPVKIGTRAVAWLLSDLSEWMAERIAKRDAQAA